MTGTVRWLALTVATTAMTGCIYVGDWGDANAYRQDSHSTYPLNAGGRISIESFNGSIDVVGWEQNSVEVNATKYASIKSSLDEIKIDVSSAPDYVHIRAVRPSDIFRSVGVRFSIRVPHKAVLELVSSSNAKIEVDDLESNARLRTSNGGIRLLRFKGDVEARTSNGNIDAEDFKGNANLHTSNGSIRAEGTGGSFDADTSNGRIIARLSNPDTARPVRAHSSNGHIELTLEGKQLPDVRASTSNSSILLRLPESANARVRAHTSHSSVSSEFDELHSREGAHGRHSDLDGTLGRGGPLLDLETSNGPIKITRL
jgi:putative adhesin